jgi:hypothetical protein
VLSHAIHSMCLIHFSVLRLIICALGVQIECRIEAAVFLGEQRCVPTCHNTIHSDTQRYIRLACMMCILRGVLNYIFGIDKYNNHQSPVAQTYRMRREGKSPFLTSPGPRY